MPYRDWGARRAASAACLLATGALVTCTVKTRALPPCDPSAGLPELQAQTEVTVVAAGDIADCRALAPAHLTADLVDRIAPDAVLGLGDLAYPNGSLEEFVDCYGPTWGRFRSITRPAIGNHEYHASHAGPYFAYFCGAAGPPFQGYTSFELGPWHVVSLNSNCGRDLDLPAGVDAEFGGCGADSPQAKWLAADLAAHPARCTMAIWHHPRFTSGSGGHGEANNTFMSDLWRILDDAGVDLALQGHLHNYERFAPQDAEGNLEPEKGIRSFVVGTGGAPLRPIGAAARNSEVRRDDAYGVLKLILRADSYEWSFLAAPGGEVLDQGTGTCGQ